MALISWDAEGNEWLHPDIGKPHKTGKKRPINPMGLDICTTGTCGAMDGLVEYFSSNRWRL